jgi:hypothetical protein
VQNREISCLKEKEESEKWCKEPWSSPKLEKFIEEEG